MEDQEIAIKNILTLLNEKLFSWYEMIVKSIPNIIVAIVVFFIFLMLSKASKRLSDKLLPRFTKNLVVSNLLRSVISFTVLTLGLFVCLEILNLDKTVTSILAGAGVIGLALGFAFQEIASNFVAGVLIAFREPYKLGDIVEIDKYFGEVTNITLRTTSITTFQGLEVLVPNKMMFTQPFINLTTTPYRRLDLEVGVSYSDDLEEVTRITKEALESVEERIKNKEIEVFFTEFGASSINLTARIWVPYPKGQTFLLARHNAIINIKKAYDKNGITIPFPIRTLDFGDQLKTLGTK